MAHNGQPPLSPPTPPTPPLSPPPPPLSLPPPPLRRLRIYNRDKPDEFYPSMTYPSSFPINISVSTSLGVAIYFTFTNNSVTIFTPLDVNNVPPQLQNIGGHNQAQNIHPPKFHGLTLPNLPTLPAHIKFTYNDHTFELLVKSEPAIFLIDPSLPCDHHLGNGNPEVIERPIVLPFSLILPFNNGNDPRIFIMVTIIISSDDILITTYYCPGICRYVAIICSPDA